jgi:RNA recognition motif-containing protein
MRCTQVSFVITLTNAARKLTKEIRFPQIKGKTCRVLPFEKDLKIKKFDTKSSLFIKNLSKDWTHKDLYEMFKDFGDINSVKVSLNENHLSRGYGFVQFSREEFALRAIQEVNYKILLSLVQWKSYGRRR